MALELKCVIETSLITVSYHCINHSFHFNSYLKQLYISIKSEHFSYKSGCGMMRIEAFKRRAGLGYKQTVWVISSIMLFKTVICTIIKLKNKAVLNLKLY